MGMAFIDYCTELMGTIPRMSQPLAATYINRAWEMIQDMRLWSFRCLYADITTPAVITTGSVTCTLGSNQVQFDAPAQAALLPAVLANPPLAGGLGVGRQFRVTSNVVQFSGAIYTIDSYDTGTGIATLDRVYAEPSASNTLYQVYKCYYAPPSPNFLRYFTLRNMGSGYNIRGKKLYTTQAKLNAIDPQRGGTGDTYILAALQSDSSGTPVHEWYPHPVNAGVYNCYYQTRKTVLSDTQDLPSTFPSYVLMERAILLGAQWAQSQVASDPVLASVNWVQFSKDRMASFKDALILAIKQDDEIFPRVPFADDAQFDFPLGGQFLQTHDLSSFFPG